MTASSRLSLLLAGTYKAVIQNSDVYQLSRIQMHQLDTVATHPCTKDTHMFAAHMDQLNCNNSYKSAC
jgi:hypothetical protein